jgi:hypothetical protein
MSWFRRIPKSKSPIHQVPQRTSPTSERLLKETKEETKPTKIQKKNGRTTSL